MLTANCMASLLECLDGEDSAACEEAAVPLLLTVLVACAGVLVLSALCDKGEPIISERAKVVGVVTGASRGIGYQIARRICMVQSQAPATLVVTSRATGDAAAAAARLSAEFPLCKVEGRALDLRIASSCESFSQWLHQNHPDCNTLVNNAGVSSPAAECIPVNYVGTRQLSCGMWPVLKANHGRIITVTSSVGQLSASGGGGCPLAVSNESNQFTPDQQKQLLECKSTAKLDKLVESFEGREENAYAVSKCFENQLCRVLATAGSSEVGVVACCPGLCRTGLNRSWGFWFAKWCFGVSAFQGANTPTWLALCDDAEFARMNGSKIQNFQDKSRGPVARCQAEECWNLVSSTHQLIETLNKVAGALTVLTLIGSLMYLWRNATAKSRADTDSNGTLSPTEVEAWHHDDEGRMSGCSDDLRESDMLVTTIGSHTSIE